MKYASAIYTGLCCVDPVNALIARVRAELLTISIELSRMLPNKVGVCWSGRTVVVQNDMGRVFGIALMEIEPSATGWPVKVVWVGEEFSTPTFDGLSAILLRLLTDSRTARIVAFVAAVPGVKLSSDEVDLAEKSVEHPELFRS